MPPDARIARSPGPLALLSLVIGAMLLAACGNTVQRADAYEALADTLMSNKAYPAAIQALNSATQIDSNEPRRWVKLGRAWRALDNPALAAISYQRALDLDPANIEALQNLSVLMVRAGRYDDAKQYTQPLLMLQPNDPGGLLATGAIAFYEKRLGDADKIAGQIIQQAPDMSDGYVLRARVLESLGHPDQAAALLSHRLQLDQGNVALAVQVMDLYRRLGDLQGIRQTALTLADLIPGDLSYQFEAARAHHAAGREEKAREILGKLLAKYPTSPGINSAVADYWISTLPKEQAIATIVGMAEKLHGRARLLLTTKLVQLGSPDAAIRLLAPEVAGPVTLGNLDLHAGYARALLAAGRTKEASDRADQVLAVDQNDEASLVRANAQIGRHDYDAALITAQAVRDNDPDNEEGALLVAKVYEAQGNLVLARKAYGDAMSAIPNSLRVIQTYVDFLLRHETPDDAVAVAAQFAQSHPRMGAARDYVRRLCGKLKTRTCTAAQNNKRAPWNL